MCILSKKAIAIHFGLYNPRSMRIDYRKLRRKVITDEVLAEVGISQERYASIRVFTVQESCRLIKALNITAYEQDR